MLPEINDYRDLARLVAHDLEDKDAWCQNAVATNKHGQTVGARDSDAVQWCALGRAWLRNPGEEIVRDLRNAYTHRFRARIERHNDGMDYGREYVRARLLELANTEPAHAS